MNLSAIEVVKMRHNLLEDEDMRYVTAFVESLARSSLKQQLRVDLSSNRFHGYNMEIREKFDSALCQLLSLDKVVFVIVCHNMLLSSDRKDFFTTVPMEILSKIIWVPRLWLKRDLWKSLVSGRPATDVADIKAIHEQYYALFE